LEALDCRRHRVDLYRDRLGLRACLAAYSITRESPSLLRRIELLCYRLEVMSTVDTRHYIDQGTNILIDIRYDHVDRLGCLLQARQNVDMVTIWTLRGKRFWTLHSPLFIISVHQGRPYHSSLLSTSLRSPLPPSICSSLHLPHHRALHFCNHFRNQIRIHFRIHFPNPLAQSSSLSSSFPASLPGLVTTLFASSPSSPLLQPLLCDSRLFGGTRQDISLASTCRAS
jgi:hypothetical protein